MWDITTGKHVDGYLYYGNAEVGDNCVIARLYTFVGLGLGLGVISLVTSGGHVKRSPA